MLTAGTRLNRLLLLAGLPVLLRGPTPETALAIAVKRWGEDLGKNEGECTGKVEIRTRKKLMAVGEACLAIF